MRRILTAAIALAMAIGGTVLLATPAFAAYPGRETVRKTIVAVLLVLAGTVVPAGSASADPGFLIRARNSNKCLDVVGGATHNGARIQQWDCNGSTQQRWYMHMDSRGDYLIVNVNSNKCLDVQAASKNDGAPLQQWDCNGEKHQKFFIQDEERIVPTHDFSKCLDVTGGPGATGNGVLIQQWTCLSNYPTNQSFY